MDSTPMFTRACTPLRVFRSEASGSFVAADPFVHFKTYCRHQGFRIFRKDVIGRIADLPASSSTS